jgi:predicted dienelactone hydrolase
VPLPAVLISHAWGGRDEFVERKARRLGWHGFAAFALDMYGKGRRGGSPEENQVLMAPFLQDRALLARRINAALTAVKGLAPVDARRVAAMGFCFGGLCVLDLARSGAELRGVVSFTDCQAQRPAARGASRQEYSCCTATTIRWRCRRTCSRWRASSRRPAPTGSCTPTVIRCIPSPTRPPRAQAACSTATVPIAVRGTRCFSSRRGPALRGGSTPMRERCGCAVRVLLAVALLALSVDGR